MSDATPAPPHPQQGPSLLALGALGVVYGDIGTSPLYTMRECLQQAAGVPPAVAVLGSLSLVFWALILVVSIKYIGFVLRADNAGEGGIFSLLALREEASGRPAGPRRITAGVLLVLAGASLLYGEAVITPAISVLSAAEGFKAIDPGFRHIVPVVAVVILAALFAFQKHGSHRIGVVFGPVMLLWFGGIGLLGLFQVIGSPAVLAALDPRHGLRLLAQDGTSATALLGSVVLAVTGVEALFADMGHFGRRAIVRGWYGVVLPGLVLSYFGQGAWVLSHPGDPTNPFFALAPAGSGRVALVFLSIAATVIASQALISGTYSLTRQAIQLGFLPRLAVLHTNAAQPGQIYVPLVNALLCMGAIAAVLAFGSSDRLAAAYGIAVTGTMTITTLVFFPVMRRHWGWSLAATTATCGAFLAVDLTFLIANLHKFTDGGWFPVAIGIVVITVMWVWKKGRTQIAERVYGHGDTEVELAAIARSPHIVRVPGVAVFMAANPRGTPLALLHHLKANKALQKTAILLSVITDQVPTVPEVSRVGIEDCGEGVWRVLVRYGYMESPDLGSVISRLKDAGLRIDPMQATYYFNREMILPGGNAPMFEWEKRLYAFLSRNARPARDYYQIPPAQIIEIGLPVQL